LSSVERKAGEVGGIGAVVGSGYLGTGAVYNLSEGFREAIDNGGWKPGTTFIQRAAINANKVAEALGSRLASLGETLGITSTSALDVAEEAIEDILESAF